MLVPDVDVNPRSVVKVGVFTFVRSLTRFQSSKAACSECAASNQMLSLVAQYPPSINARIVVSINTFLAKAGGVVIAAKSAFDSGRYVFPERP